MTLAYEVKRVLADDGGWMTARQVCAVLDRGREEPVRGGKVSACLRCLADRGRAERICHADADTEYRLLGEPTCKPFVDNARHREYIKAMPDGEFSARDLAGAMRVTRQVASRHLARAVEDGVVERIGENRRTVYRRVEHEREGRAGRLRPHDGVADHGADRGAHTRLPRRHARLPPPGDLQASP